MPRPRRLDVAKIRQASTAEALSREIRTCFTTRADGEVSNQWSSMKTSVYGAAEKILGYTQRRRSDWISGRTLQLSAQTARARSRNDDYFRQLRKMTAKSARDDRKQYWAEIATSMEQASNVGDTRKLYQLIRQVSGKPSTLSDSVRNVNGGFIADNSAKVERWREHFEHHLNYDTQLTSPLLSSSAEFPPSPTYAVPCDPPSEEEIVDAIRKLRNNKAPGEDGIAAEIFKSCVDTLAPWLHEVIERAWRDEVVPDDWGLGILVPILKKGDKTRCENYRCISLIDVAAKIFAIVLLRRFQAVRDSRTRPNQAGFRAARGCADQIFTLRRILEFRHSYQQPTAVCFVDFAAAFDSMVYRQKIIAMIKAYYRSTTARVLVRNNLSQPFGIRSGVRQGCILSPILFNYAIDWILGRALRDSDGVEIAPGHRLTDLDYADDIALLASSFGDLQSMVSRVNEVAKSVGLSINAGKTKVFSSCIPDQEKAPLGIDGCQLEEVDSFKYLGARLLPNGQSKDDIVSRIDAARWVFSSLRKCLWNRRDLSIATKIRVYRASVRSVLLYGCECWALRVEDERNLEVFDHHCLRIILRVKFTDFVSNDSPRSLRQHRKDNSGHPRKTTEVTATSWMQASPNVLHYTQMMSRFEEEVRKRRLDEVFQKQFPEHSSLMSESRTEQEMRHLDRGIIRALSLTTNVNENELCLSTCLRKYDRLHASYEILSDKINHFIKTPALREAVDQAILEATANMTNPPGLQRQASQHSISEDTPSPLPPAPPHPSLGVPSTASPSTTPVAGTSDSGSGGDRSSSLPAADFRPPALAGSTNNERLESKLSIWREEEEEEEDEEEEDEQEDEELQRQQESSTAGVTAAITWRQGVEGSASKEVEADDIFLTSAVGNLAILGSGRSADLTAVAASDTAPSYSQEKQKMDAESTSVLEESVQLRQDWAADYHAKKMDVRIALAILQADENEILNVVSEHVPQTAKHLRRHTIQLPSPTVGRRRTDMSHPSVSECESALQEGSPVDPAKGPSTTSNPAAAAATNSQEGERAAEVEEEELGEAPDGDTKGVKTRKRSLIRIPRQITQPEFGSWRGLQREVTTGPSVALMSGEDDSRWLSSVWPRPEVKLGGRGSDVFLNIVDKKELSLDLGQEASNTRPPSELLLASLSCAVTKTEELPPEEPQPAVEKDREKQSIGLSVSVAGEVQPCSSEGNQPQEQKALVGELGQFLEECNVTTGDGWDSMPHYVGGDLLPQLNLPACLPSMIHQPVARFTVKDPNLLAPPEFMTPHSSSFPRRSSDGAADIPTLHRPYPVVGGSFPEQANYRSEHKSTGISPDPEDRGQRADEKGLSTAAWLQWSFEASGASAPTVANPLPVEPSAATPAAARAGGPQLTSCLQASAETCETLGGGEGPTATHAGQTAVMEKVDVAAAAPIGWAAFGSSASQFTPVLNTQKRFSLPARQPSPLIEEVTARARTHEARTSSQCCCDQLVSSFLAQHPNGVTTEDVKNFKALLHSSLHDTALFSCLLVPPSGSTGEEGGLGAPFTVVSSGGGGGGSSDWLRSSSVTATNAFADTPRRGSEATQLRAWKERLSQLYGTDVTLERSRFPDLEALAQVKKQELQPTEGVVVMEGRSISPKTSLSQEANLPDTAAYLKSPKRSAVYRVDSQHSLVYSGPSNEVLAETPALPRFEACAHFPKATENPPLRETQIDAEGAFDRDTAVRSRTLEPGTPGVSGVFRGHSSWNEKRNIGFRPRHPLQRSKSQASWADMQQQGAGTVGQLSVMAQGQIENSESAIRLCEESINESSDEIASEQQF
ncbi:hypothetical protein SprV_0902714900 [Sparganum proliferum]